MTTIIQNKHIEHLVSRHLNELKAYSNNCNNIQEAIISGFRFGWQLANQELKMHQSLTKSQLDQFLQQHSVEPYWTIQQNYIEAAKEGLNQAFNS